MRRAVRCVGHCRRGTRHRCRSGRCHRATIHASAVSRRLGGGDKPTRAARALPRACRAIAAPVYACVHVWMCACVHALERDILLSCMHARTHAMDKGAHKNTLLHACTHMSVHIHTGACGHAHGLRLASCSLCTPPPRAAPLPATPPTTAPLPVACNAHMASHRRGTWQHFAGPPTVSPM